MNAAFTERLQFVFKSSGYRSLLQGNEWGAPRPNQR